MQKNTATETKPIGFSTGCLYKSGMTLEDQIIFYASLGATTIELSFSHSDRLHAFHLSGKIKDALKKFERISIHAPWRNLCYQADTATAEIIKKLHILCNQLPVNGIVLHPNIVSDFGFTDNCRLPFCLENMDSRKNGQYATPEQFQKLMEAYNFGFVLDLQHAYEHDPSMELARRFLAIMGDRIKELHVSGGMPTEIHWPVHLADNREAISQLLKITRHIPWIFEGLLADNIADVAAKELHYARAII